MTEAEYQRMQRFPDVYARAVHKMEMLRREAKRYQMLEQLDRDYPLKPEARA